MLAELDKHMPYALVEILIVKEEFLRSKALYALDVETSDYRKWPEYHI